MDVYQYDGDLPHWEVKYVGIITLMLHEGYEEIFIMQNT